MTDKVIIFHNPRCSKSRACLELITSMGITPRVKLYLDEIIRIVPQSNDMHTSNFITLCKAIRTQTKSDFHPQADFIIHISSLSWG